MKPRTWFRPINVSPSGEAMAYGRPDYAPPAPIPGPSGTRFAQVPALAFASGQLVAQPYRLGEPDSGTQFGLVGETSFAGGIATGG